MLLSGREQEVLEREIMTKARKLAWKKIGINVLKFTAPSLAALFGQLALGVELKQAIPFAVVILWGLIADAFKKLK